MTPRVVAATADENMSIRAFLKHRHYLRFARIPVYSGDKENITGYIYRQTAFSVPSAKNQKMKLKDIKRDIVMVNESKPLFYVWEMLLEKKEQIAVVYDEYGGLEGIVTLEDIIETLLGFEIIDENDANTDMQHYARERWKMRQKKYAVIESINRSKKAKLKK